MTTEGSNLLEFKVFVGDKPGELARVTEALAASAVNIVAIASEINNATPFYRIVTNDVNTTRKALHMAGLRYEENEILVAELIDRPGELAKVARRLARTNVNISSIYILGAKNGKTQIALTVDNPQRAKRLFKV
ncbi:MAG: ACT domain-containing protein [Thermoplasmata archaeon]